MAPGYSARANPTPPRLPARLHRRRRTRHHLPPLPEQHEIVRRVENLFALANQLQARYERARVAQVDKLAPSCLARAFSGKLVPQDPHDELRENPVLLDPVRPADVDLLDVGDDGRVGASRLAVGTAKVRVKRSAELYGLNLPGIKAARLRLMREIQGMLQVLSESLESANGGNMPDQAADRLPIQRQRDLIRAKTLPESPYSRAARAEIIRGGWADILPKPEEYEHLRAAML